MAKANPDKVPRERLIVEHGGGTVYSDRLADIILLRMANGETVLNICSDDGMPCAATVTAWYLRPDEKLRPGFASRFQEARRIGLDVMADEIIAIADDSSNDIIYKMVNGQKVRVVNQEHIQRSKLRIDTRFRLLQARNKAEFGDQVKVEHGVDNELREILASARGRAKSAQMRVSDRAASKIAEEKEQAAVTFEGSVESVDA